MKRLIALVTCIFLTGSIVLGCQAIDSRYIVFAAVIETVQSDSLIVTTSDDVGFDKANVRYMQGLKVDFVPAQGQTIEVRILPEIAESYPVQVTAVSIRLLSWPTTSEGYPHAFIRTHARTDAAYEFLSDWSENSQSLMLSWRQHLPIVKFDELSDVSEFIEEGQACFDFAAADDGPSFIEWTNQYDDAYFEQSILLVVFLPESSGSNRHEIDSLTSDNGLLEVRIQRIVPETGTDDMAYWFILLEVQKDRLQQATRFDAYINQ